MRDIIIAFLLVFFPLAMLKAQQNLPSQEELAKMPMYARMLSEDNEKKVNELIEKADAAESEGRLSDVLSLRRQVVSIRAVNQGSDHWQVVSAKMYLNSLEKLDQITLKELIEAFDIEEQGDTLAQEKKFNEAIKKYQVALAVYRKLLGDSDYNVFWVYNKMGVNLESSGEFDDAQRYLRYAFDGRCQLLGENHPDTSATANNLANVLASQGLFRESEELFQKSLEICIRVFGEMHEDTASTYSNLALLIQEQGRFDEAELMLRRAMQIRLDLLGKDTSEFADSLDNLSLNLQLQGRIAEARGLANDALSIRRRLLGEEHSDTATSYGNVASILEEDNRFVEAFSLREESLRIALRIFGDKHPSVAIASSNLASNLESRYQYVTAQPYHQKALDINLLRFGEAHPDTIICFSKLGKNLSSQGKYSESDRILLRAIDICKRFKKSSELSYSYLLAGLANNFFSQGDYDQAVAFYQDALRIQAERLGENHPDLSIIYGNLGVVYQQQGRVQEAQRFLEMALVSDKEFRGEFDVRTATSALNLAGFLSSQGKVDEAFRLLLQAEDSFRSILGDSHSRTATAYTNLGYLHHSVHQQRDAIANLENAVRSFDSARLLHSSGIFRSVQGLSDPRLLLAAIGQARFPVDSWHQIEIGLARGLIDQASPETVDLSIEEERFLDSVNSELEQVQPRIFELSRNVDRGKDLQAELSVLVQRKRELDWKLSEFAVGRSARGVASFAEIKAAITPRACLLVWVDAMSNICEVQEHFACVVRREGDPFWVRLPGSGEGGAWTKADSDLPGRVRDALAKELPPEDIEEMVAALRRQRIEPVLHHLSQHGIDQLLVVGVNQMAGVPIEVLAPEFAISYVPSGTFLARLPKKPAYDKSLLAVGDPVYELDTGKHDRSAALPPHGLLVREAVAEGAGSKAGIRSGDVLLQYGDRKLESVDELRQSIQDFIDAGRDTIDVVIWRVGVDGFAVENTVTVPIGPLGVSLSPDPAPTAISDAREADSFFSSIRRGDNWTDLPGTRYEVSRISELFPNANVLLDRDASERGIEGLRVSGELSKFRYLHFATHGKGNSNSAFESKLALAQDGEKEEFAQAGSPWMNNEISAREVLDHWKIGADLVTLSACESGVGRQGGGDGLLGFTQAFLISGARSVCLSLWNVDDTATALLMHRFYQNLLGRRPGLSSPMTKVAALKEAKEWLRSLSTSDALDAASDLTKGVSRGGRGEVTLKTRIGSEKSIDKPFSEPHYWSAFILVGDPE